MVEALVVLVVVGGFGYFIYKRVTKNKTGTGGGGGGRPGNGNDNTNFH